MYNYLHIISLYVDTFCKGFVIYLLWDLSWVYKSFIIWSCNIFLIMWANYIGQKIWSHVQFVHAKIEIEHGTFVLLNVYIIIFIIFMLYNWFHICFDAKTDVLVMTLMWKLSHHIHFNNHDEIFIFFASWFLKFKEGKVAFLWRMSLKQRLRRRLGTPSV